ncbi:thiamine pyrophosphate-binding protein [uncultured Castellaniella sp.]|uniref:thiamine pyrophosphate-binding protein n=1 Tax=uncultured Castellaniella sp. TaxID=647907 RepID=UPI002616C6DE|nr:thiamine pyrophosphate-binding protein [uncultured Castellaniella sp.]
MSLITGGEAVVGALKAQGVDHVFGLIGSAGMEVFDALYKAPGIKYIGVRDERTGVHMADGYARASGKAGVFLAGQNGPGATNLVTGLAQAYAAYSPVVALTGFLSSAHVCRDAFQEVDQQALFKPITKKTYTLTKADRIPEMVAESFRNALSPRPGPAVLNLPRDLLAEKVDDACLEADSPVFIANHSTGARQSIREAVRLLSQAKQPLIIAGGGVKNGRHQAALMALAECLNAPVAASPGHGDAFPCSHRLYAGQVGPRGNAVASDLAKSADVILALGTRLGFNTTFYLADSLNPSAKIIQTEQEATAIGRFRAIAVGIQGNEGDIAEDLLAGLAGHEAAAPVRQWTETFVRERAALLAERDKAVSSANGRIQPSALFRALRSVCPEDSLYTLDAGTLCLQATDQLCYHRTPSLFTPLDFGLVGFSFACALGAKLALPDRTVVSLMGDGGFGMACSELGTAVEHGINVVCIVMNNGCWGAEKAYQRDFFGQRYIGADVRNPPYDELARLWGAAGYRVDAEDAIADTVREALSCGRPAVVDIRVDPEALYSFRKDSFKNRNGG